MRLVDRIKEKRENGYTREELKVVSDAVKTEVERLFGETRDNCVFLRFLDPVFKGFREYKTNRLIPVLEDMLLSNLSGEGLKVEIIVVDHREFSFFGEGESGVLLTLPE